MKSENNGKIAIAIVAMFVVALSVVGFTYAYFTASVVRNQDEKTTEVTAGMLEVNYTQNKTMTAQKVIPGWESDGLHYFGTETATKEDGTTELRTKAMKAADTADVTAKGLKAADGITGPAAFNVANTARTTGKSTYVIKLINIINGIAANNATDASNLTYELYSVNAADTYTGGTRIATGKLPATGEEKVISNVIEINKGAATQYYYLMLKYADTGKSQNDSQAATVSLTVKVVGVTTNDGGTTYIDAEGNTVVPVVPAP